MATVYTDPLNDFFMEEAQKQNHVHWGTDKTHSERMSVMRKLLTLGGKNLYRTAGLIKEHHLVSSMKRYGLEIEHPKLGFLKGFGFGAVFTPPELRGQGFGTLMLREALRHEKENGSDFAVLFSGIGADYYQNIGFKPVLTKGWMIRTEDLPHDKNIKTHEASSEELEWIRETYHSECRFQHRPFIFHSPLTFKFFRMRNSVNPDLIIQGKYGKGSINVAVDGAKLLVEEALIGTLETHELWTAVHLEAKKRKCEEVCGWTGLTIPDGAQEYVMPKCLPMIFPLTEDWQRDVDFMISALDRF